MKRRFDWVTPLQLAAIPVGVVAFSLLLGEGRVVLAWTVAAISVAAFLAGSVIRNAVRRRMRTLVRDRLDDSVLGPLRYDGEESWTATVVVDAKELKFKIGGDTHPDLGLVAQAHRLVRSTGEFRTRVQNLLDEMAEREPQHADELRKLEIEEVLLFDGGGMIYFTGGDPERVWRCDLVDEKPVGLGFDS